MFSVGLVYRTVHNSLRFRRHWNRYLYKLSDGWQTSVVNQLLGLNTLAKAVKGELGGIFYDLTDSSFGRLEAQITSAEVLSIVTIIDDFIDENGISPPDQISLINYFQEAAITGNTSATHYDEEQLQVLKILCRDLHRRITQTPFPDRFFCEYANLAEAVKTQIEGDSSLENAAKIGAGSMSVTASIPYCYNGDIPKRHLTAAKYFGSYWNIIDDISDHSLDTALGINTFMTVSEDAKATRSKARQFANNQYGVCLSTLPTNEQRIYRTLNLLFTVVFVHDRYLQSRS